MERLRWLLGLGALLFVVLSVTGCGGSAGGEGACDYPTCVADVEKDCIVTAACTKQQTTTASGDEVDACFANGSKMQSVTSIDADTKKLTTSFAAKNPSGVVCMSSEMSFDAIGRTGAITYKNGSGSIVATAVVNSNADVTFTCVDGRTKTLHATCVLPDAGSGGSSTCTPGTCVF